MFESSDTVVVLAVTTTWLVWKYLLRYLEVMSYSSIFACVRAVNLRRPCFETWHERSSSIVVQELVLIVY